MLEEGTTKNNDRDSCNTRLLSHDDIIVEEKIRQLSQEFSASYRRSEVDPEESKKYIYVDLRLTRHCYERFSFLFNFAYMV